MTLSTTRPSPLHPLHKLIRFGATFNVLYSLAYDAPRAVGFDASGRAGEVIAHVQRSTSKRSSQLSILPHPRTQPTIYTDHFPNTTFHSEARAADCFTTFASARCENAVCCLVLLKLVCACFGEFFLAWFRVYWSR